LSHQRLSIIDLSEVSAYPKVDNDNGSVVIYNGELYNYLELKEELIAAGISLNTKTDTEVLLKAYSFWGPQKSLQKFNGMWAFAIFNKRENKILLSRDR
jgi:asparagine synthase (glutamine-hydrolysing)